jgi:hypothetical protein
MDRGEEDQEVGILILPQGGDTGDNAARVIVENGEDVDRPLGARHLMVLNVAQIDGPHLVGTAGRKRHGLLGPGLRRWARELIHLSVERHDAPAGPRAEQDAALFEGRRHAMGPDGRGFLQLLNGGGDGEGDFAGTFGDAGFVGQARYPLLDPPVAQKDRHALPGDLQLLGDAFGRPPFQMEPQHRLAPCLPVRQLPVARVAAADDVWEGGAGQDALDRMVADPPLEGNFANDRQFVIGQRRVLRLEQQNVLADRSRQQAPVIFAARRLGL